MYFERGHRLVQKPTRTCHLPHMHSRLQAKRITSHHIKHTRTSPPTHLGHRVEDHSAGATKHQQVAWGARDGGRGAGGWGLYS